MINLAIMSGSQLYCDAIDALLEQSSHINVAESVNNTAGILSLLERFRIDVVLLDMRLKTSEEILTFVAKGHMSVKFIIMSDSFEKYINHFTYSHTNICGYLANHATIEELIDAVETVYKGKAYYSGNITQVHLNTNYTAQYECDAPTMTDPATAYNLTRREIQITELLLQGQSNKKISRKLIIEVSTVKNHVHNIFVKLGVENRMHIAELFSYKKILQTTKHSTYERLARMNF